MRLGARTEVLWVNREKEEVCFLSGNLEGYHSNISEAEVCGIFSALGRPLPQRGSLNITTQETKDLSFLWICGVCSSSGWSGLLPTPGYAWTSANPGGYPRSYSWGQSFTLPCFAGDGFFSSLREFLSEVSRGQSIQILLLGTSRPDMSWEAQGMLQHGKTLN